MRSAHLKVFTDTQMLRLISMPQGGLHCLGGRRRLRVCPRRLTECTRTMMLLRIQLPRVFCVGLQLMVLLMYWTSCVSSVSLHTKGRVRVTCWYRYRCGLLFCACHLLVPVSVWVTCVSPAGTGTGVGDFCASHAGTGTSVGDCSVRVTYWYRYRCGWLRVLHILSPVLCSNLKLTSETVNYR